MAMRCLKEAALCKDAGTGQVTAQGRYAAAPLLFPPSPSYIPRPLASSLQVCGPRLDCRESQNTWLNFLCVSSHAAPGGAAAMLSLAGPRISGTPTPACHA